MASKRVISKLTSLTGIYLIAALIVMLPLLGPGYILTLDMVFTPELPMPQHLSSSYIFQALLHFTNLILPSDIIQKLILVAILLLSGHSAHYLMRTLKPEKPDTFGTYGAGILYMINPFTYSRFMAGQYMLLLGYALLPFFVRALLLFFAKPKRKTAIVMALWVISISLVSLHVTAQACLLALLALLLAFWKYRKQTSRLKSVGVYGLMGAGLALIASSYWLIPLVRGTSKTAEALQTFGRDDLQAFATLGGSTVAKVAHVIRLQGFWAEDRALYHLPQDVLAGWGLVIVGLWVLVAVGARSWWRQGRRFVIALLGLASVLACIVATGALNDLILHSSLMSGYREPQKLIGLIALLYALCAGQGADVIIQRLSKRSELFGNAALGVFCMLPIAITPTMPWGFRGQLSPRHYPADWFAVNEQLRADNDAFRVVFLPWHLYMHFDFAGRIIANPAKDFFAKPILVSGNPEFGGASSVVKSREAQLVDALLVNAPNRTDLGAHMVALDVKYLVLAKDSDYDQYSYLDHQQDVVLERETQTLKIYRNQAWKE